MCTRPTSPSRHQVTGTTASDIALSSWKRLPWWLDAIMKLWRVIRPHQRRRGSDPPKQGNADKSSYGTLSVNNNKHCNVTEEFHSRRERTALRKECPIRISDLELSTQTVMEFIENCRSDGKPCPFECPAQESHSTLSVTRIFGKSRQTPCRGRR
jgi:hypothetical protein